MHDPVLEHLLLDGGRPTADEYIGMNWMGTEVPKDMDDEEREIIELLRALEKAKD
jgi:hypothetical protein